MAEVAWRPARKLGEREVFTMTLLDDAVSELAKPEPDLALVRNRLVDIAGHFDCSVGG